MSPSKLLPKGQHCDQPQQLLVVEKAPRSGGVKKFLNNHSSVVDFISFSLIVTLCLVVLLPQVHESFLQPTEETSLPDNLDNSLNSTTSSGGSTQESIGTAAEAIDNTHGDHNHHHHHHHHHHGFPIGEALICLGFFVFYCIGLKLEQPVTVSPEEQTLLGRRRSVSAIVCCSSTRCPSSVQPGASGSNLSKTENTEIARMQQVVDTETPTSKPVGKRDPDDFETDCLLLLNQHHQHHTHSRHHEHRAIKDCSTAADQQFTFANGASNVELGMVASKRSDYGTESSNNNSDNHGLISQRKSTPRRTIVIDEIKITSPPISPGVKDQCWPRSLKMLLVSVTLAAFIILLDFNALGLLKTLKVFCATSTGALLYIAFFVMLPRQRAGCNSCQEEEN